MVTGDPHRHAAQFQTVGTLKRDATFPGAGTRWGGRRWRNPLFGLRQQATGAVTVAVVFGKLAHFIGKMEHFLSQNKANLPGAIGTAVA